MSNVLIFEILAEELPAAYIPKATASMETLLRKSFEAERIGYRCIRTFGTPRRLAFIMEGLAERQSDATIEVKGPQKKAAFDASGNPTPALLGFTRTQGVDVSAVKIASTDKGDYAMVVKEIKGQETGALLPGILKAVVSGEVFAKSMRWGGHEVSFARPVHGILAVYCGKTVEVTWGHIKSSGATSGHRFLSDRRPIPVDTVESYIEGLRRASVIVDPVERKKIIMDGLLMAATAAKGVLLQDPGLVEEVSYLVEYPVVIRGNFDPEFLTLPRDVVINAMREHQRYFAVTGSLGGLLPYFITVANTRPVDEDVVRKGNERVLRARLNDARFYFEQDIKKPLYERVGALKGVIFQARLGTSYEKVERFTALALFIGAQTGFSRAPEPGEQGADFLTESFNPAQYDAAALDPGLYSKYVVGRAAMLAKADLTSGMVGEFPKLQGVMGGVYARKSGEVEAVAIAVREHYLPTVSGGLLPASIPGAIISIADKLDTIVGCRSVGILPTGSIDPYALRRSALGIIAIILDMGLRVSLDVLIDKSIELHHANMVRDASRHAKTAKSFDIASEVLKRKAAVRADVSDFFRERLRNQLLSQSIAFDSIDAVFGAPSNGFDIVDIVARVKAIEDFKTDPACPRLVAAFKRVSNILKGMAVSATEPDIKLFTEPAERGLYEAASKIAPLIAAYENTRDYTSIFAILASIKDAVDAFFDKVLVMSDDERIRTNRLTLLNLVRDLYFKTADLSKLNA